MKTFGIIKKIDLLGRVLIPKEIREFFDLKEDDPVEISVEGDRIVLKKHTPCCVFCQSDRDLTEYKDKTVCTACLDELTRK